MPLVITITGKVIAKEKYCFLKIAGCNNIVIIHFLNYKCEICLICDGSRKIQIMQQMIHLNNQYVLSAALLI